MTQMEIAAFALAHGLGLPEEMAALRAEVERLRRDVTEAHAALAEAARRFTKGDTEGVRQILCDTNARLNVSNAIEQAEAKLAEVVEALDAVGKRLDAMPEGRQRSDLRLWVHAALAAAKGKP